MDRRLALVLAVYAPHLVEEHVTGMWNDRLIRAAFAPLEALPARQSAYLVFQIMLAIGLAMTWAYSRGGRSRDAVLAGLGLSLLAESHHVVRAVGSFAYDSGLVTSLPMPLVGAFVLVSIVRAPSRAANATPPESTRCSTTSSSPWESGASFSESRPSSPPRNRLAFSGSLGRTTRRLRG